MWRLIACCSFDNAPMASKIFFDLNYFSIILLLIFLATINGTRAHSAMDNDLNSREPGFHEDYILCQNCGADVGAPRNIINHLSPYAEVITNETVYSELEVDIQILTNPLGIEYHTITLSNSRCTPVHDWTTEYTWYPGYAWKPCICNYCRVHHGWIFEPIQSLEDNSSTFPTDKGFFLLKIYNLLSENFADSLIVRPKSLYGI